MIKQLKPAELGTIVAAALDGDGDRCLIIRATSTGFKVVDGDEIPIWLLMLEHFLVMNGF